MKLTFGFAHFDDSDSAIFTIQSLRMHHPEVMPETEFIIVDNSPNSPHGECLKKFCQSGITHGNAGVTYVANAANQGTSHSRSLIFQHAKGDNVLVADCHVLFPLGAIQNLIRYFDEHPKCMDLLHGPIMYSNLSRRETHFDYTWSSQMRGQWAAAWTCGCDKPLRFSVSRRWPSGILYRDITRHTSEVTGCWACGKRMPLNIGFEGYEPVLHAAGFTPLGYDRWYEPFEIPAMGLGSFACRRKAWLGFPEGLEAFGGEECEVHELWRQHGRKILSVPVPYWHKFERAKGAPYRNTLQDKIGNYLIWRKKLNEGTDDIYEHFVSLDTHGEPLAQHLMREHGIPEEKVNGKSEAELQALHKQVKLPEDQWRTLLKDPNAFRLSRQLATAAKDRLPDQGRPQPPTDAGIDATFAFLKSIPRDFDQHAETLREYASRCDHVTAFTKRREPPAFLLAGRPKTLVTYLVEYDQLDLHLRKIVKDERTKGGKVCQEYTSHVSVAGDDRLSTKFDPESFVPTDLLLIHSIHTADYIYEELSRVADKLRRYVMIFGSTNYGENGEGGGPGLLSGWRHFQDDQWQRDIDWKLVYTTDAQYGLKVYSKHPDDKSIERGVGSNLKKLMAKLKVYSHSGCDCNSIARDMDEKGSVWCRENFDKIVAAMKANWERWTWAAQFRAAAVAATMAVATGLAAKVNWLDPLPGLLEEAIRITEEEERAEND